MNGLAALARMPNEQPKLSTLMALASAATVEVRTLSWYWWAYTYQSANVRLEALARSNTR